jgi:hypothetical protein
MKRRRRWRARLASTSVGLSEKGEDGTMRMRQASGRGYATIVACAVGAILTADAAGQTPECAFRGAADALAERASPLDSAEIVLGDAAAKLCYGRPSLRGRDVLGVLDPYGQPWRLGANEPTTLHLPFLATVGGVDLPAGSYSLYAIPEDGPWTIVINRNIRRWGIPINAEVRSADVGSFIVHPRRTDEPTEVLTFLFDGSGGMSGSLVFAWEWSTFEIPISRRKKEE